MAQPREGDCQIIDQFDCLIEIDDMEPIIDIKIVSIKNFISILAVSPTKLNQFVGGDDGLKPVLDKYKNNPKLRNEHSITIPSKRNALGEESKGMDEGDMRASVNNNRDGQTE